MKASPHLVFNGDCREAIEFYRDVFGGSIATMLTYGDAPIASETPEEFHHRILHATLLLESGDEINGVDLHPADYLPPQGFYVIMTISDPEKAKSCFERLAEGGDVKMAFEPIFWSAGFGVVVDRFGIPWEINTDDGTT